MIRNYVYETGSMTGILGQLKWESLKKRRKDNRLILLYKGMKGKARIPTDDLIPKTRRGKNQHPLAFQIPSASKDVYKNSFFPQTIRDWNDLPESLISSSELSDNSVSNKNIKMSSFKSSENIQKKEGGPDRSVSDNQSSSVTLSELAMKARKDTVISPLL